ncbi:MAG TPA: hypothetical protein VMD92_08275, partial [Acidobacteriaceae bacterium]|nr:hypothetical protein [Acidobacteriaceae bacterium]
MPRRSLLIIVALLALCAAFEGPHFGLSPLHEEANRLATLLEWHKGSVVAEIGAGDGNLTLAAS